MVDISPEGMAGSDCYVNTKVPGPPAPQVAIIKWPSRRKLLSESVVIHWQTREGRGSRAGQGRAGQGRAGQGRAGQGRAGQGRAGQGRAGQGRAGQGKGRQDLPTDEHRADELLYKGVVLDASHCL